MAQFSHVTLPLECLGMNIAAPVDKMPAGKFRLLRNTRTYGNRLQGRQGTLTFSANLPNLPVNSMFNWDDPLPSPTAFPGVYREHCRLVGLGTQLWIGQCGPNPTNFAQSDPTFFTQLDTGFSGKSMSFVVASSDQNPRPFVFATDFNKMRKVASNGFPSSKIGIAPPNFAPVIALAGSNANGPNIGNTGQPYLYLFVARLDAQLNTGAVSAGGPAVRDVNGLSPAGQNILVTAPQAHPDPNCEFLDVYRFGGSLPIWIYIGSMFNFAGATLLDIYNDEDIASGATSDLDDNQPWLTIDQGLKGTCTLTANGTGLGGTMTITAGDQLRPYTATGDAAFYVAGDQVSINGTLFTFYRSPDSATSVELLEDPGAVAGSGLSFSINAPEMMHQALPCLWGPFGGGLTGSFNFACGDPQRPGAVYWTKGNHPESHPGTNVLDITSASEPIMNGLIYDGQTFAFSNRRLFALYPTLGQVTDFVALEIPNSKGLYARWGLCPTPWGIAFIGKDGVYLTAGGAPNSLTEVDMYPLFPHEGTGSSGGIADTSVFPVVDGLNTPSAVNQQPYFVPDFTKPDQMFLCFGDNMLYWDFVDPTGVQRTLVGQFDATGAFIGWISTDDYTPQVTRHYLEVVQENVVPGVSRSTVLMGTVNGKLLNFQGDSEIQGNDSGAAITGGFRTPAQDFQDSRPHKLIGDAEIDLDSQCLPITAYLGFDEFTFFSLPTTGSLNLTGRHRMILDINTGQGQYAANVGLDVSWTSTTGVPLFYLWTPSFVPKPELSILRVTDWDDCGYPGAKFFQGFKLRADTLGANRVVQVLSDGNISQPFQPATIQHVREETKAYVFTTPFISHLIRFWPQDVNFWRILGVEWIFCVAPELVGVWTTQETTHDLGGWGAHREGYISVVSSADVNLAVKAIGNADSPFSYTIPNSGGLYNKVYLPMLSMKALAWSYSLTSPQGFRLFANDSEVRVKQWASGGPFLSKQPFGDSSRQPMPARI